MKTVVLSGYYGYENMGDEALLAAIIGALKAEAPDLRIIVLSATPEKTGARYGVEAVNRVSPLAVFSALKGADLLISGGGSLLQDVTGPLTIPYYLGIVAMARVLGKPVMFYAQGIGPVNGAFGKLLIRLIANRVDAITLRDKASMAFLGQLGVCRPRVELTADPVFGMEMEPIGDGGGLPDNLDIRQGEKPLAGFFIREWQGLPGYKKAVAELADYMREKGWVPVFVPMQHPADVEPARQISRMMKSQAVLLDRRLTFNEAAGLMQSMDLVIGMRLHALIIAAVCGVPMVGLSYDPKVAEFLETIGQPVVKELASVTAAQLVRQVEEIMASSGAVRAQLVAQRADLRRKALRNARIAVELLNHKS